MKSKKDKFIEQCKGLSDVKIFDLGMLQCARIAVKNNEFKTANFIIDFLEKRVN